MFFYLHLTRPPPEKAHVSRPFLITPSIANDLRTELFPCTTDIYFAWVKCLIPSKSQQQRGEIFSATNQNKSLAGASGDGKALGPMTQPQKLFTWNGNAYKEVQVFPPREARAGESWQLLLCTKSPQMGRFRTSLDLSQTSGSKSNPNPDEGFGDVIFPILSAPVLFQASPGISFTGADGQKAEKKQVRNERILKISSSGGIGQTVAPKSAVVRMMEHLSFDLDKKVWDSGLGLAHWFTTLITNPGYSKAGNPEIIRRLVGTDRATILELGTGTGLVSIVLATLLEIRAGRARSSESTKIMATDLESAMEILQMNITNNKHLYPSIDLQPAVLDWDVDEIPSSLTASVDFIMMADVTYNTASFPSLIRTLSRLAHPPSHDNQSSPAVILAYKERDPDERRLWEMAAEMGLVFERVDDIPGQGGMPIEIYVGRFECNKA